MNSIVVLAMVAILATTTEVALGISSKKCRRRASKAASKYIDCYMDAELHESKPDVKIKKCKRKFKERYNTVEDTDGCTRKVIRRDKDVMQRITDICLASGYDGAYCLDVTATTAIDATAEVEEGFFCAQDVMQCPYGGEDVYRRRDEYRSCFFTPCCCDPILEPGVEGGPKDGEYGHVCCPDGQWTTSNLGDGKTFFCASEGDQIGIAAGSSGPFGRTCQISTAKKQKKKNDDNLVTQPVVETPLVETGDDCDPKLEPGTAKNKICADGHICCPNGNWSCGIGDGTYPCDK